MHPGFCCRQESRRLGNGNARVQPVIAAEALTGPVLHHGEGPTWFSEFNELRCVDMLRGEVVGVDERGSISRRAVGSVASFVRPMRGGGAVVGLESTIGATREDPVRASPSVFSEPFETIGVRLNEAACDPSGALICGSMSDRGLPGRGEVYRIDQSGEAELLRTGVDISNGIGFSPDGQTCYYVDSGRHAVEIIDYRNRRFNRGGAIDLSYHQGSPDGLTVDSDGNVWVAMWGGGAVLQLSPDGRLIRTIHLPVQAVTSCTFGGPDLSTLFITTSQLMLELEDPAVAGAIFVAVPGAIGQPAAEFG